MAVERVSVVAGSIRGYLTGIEVSEVDRDGEEGGTPRIRCPVRSYKGIQFVSGTDRSVGG